MNGTTEVVVRLVVAVGAVVVVPVALRLIGGVPGGLVRWWPVAGLLGALSMWWPRGPVAVSAAAVYAAATLALVGVAVVRAARWWRAGNPGQSGRRRPVSRNSLPVEVAVLTALLGPAVAATALVAERAGVELFGFDLDILTLTVPHLHFAGFAAALVAGLVARRVSPFPDPVDVEAADPADRRAATLVALTVPVGTTTVLVGYFIGDWAELVGAVVLTAGMWLAGGLLWTRVRTRSDGVAAGLFAVSAVVLVATMLLALTWAWGEATGWPHPSLDWMVATHGVANALAFGLCAVLAFRIVREEPL